MTRTVQKQAEWLANKLASQDQKIANLASRGELAHSSIEDGAIVEKDLDGNLVSSVGKQHDGSHVQVPYTGPKPAAPVAPSLKAVPGVVEVRWSGKFIGDAVSSMDFKHVAVHVSTTPVVDTTPSTQVATIRGELGDVATVTADEGWLHVALVAWSAAGKASAPSPVASVPVPAPVDPLWLQGKLDDIDERYDGVITEAGQLGQRLTDAEVVLTSAQDRLTGAESDITDAFGQISTVDGKASDAATAASTAQGKADTAKSAADQAAADALAAAGIANSKGKTLIQSAAPGAADRNAVTLWIDTTGGANTPKRWVSGTTWAAVTDKAATDAATAASAAATAAATAKSAADAAAAAAGVADGKATAAATAASNAQTKADTAKSAADAAAADALAAAGLAGSKGEIIYQVSAPTGTRANPANLWIRSSDDKPHTYDTGTSKWVARTDKAALDAATAAASAASAAAAAQSTANAAQTAAGTAGTNATAALTMAGSKSKVYYSTAVATGTGTAAGDLWRQRNAGNEVIAEWQWSGTSWIKQTVSGSNVSNMDIGFLTAGAATMSQALINKLVAGTASFQTVDVKNLFVTTGTMTEAVINKLWADVVMSRKITTQMLAVGAFDNVIPDPNFDGGQWGAMSGVYSITAEGRKGGNTLRIAANTAQSGKYSARIPLAGAASYRITVWVKSNLAIPAGAIGIYTNTKATASSGVAGANQRLRQANGAAGNGPIAANTWSQLSCVADFTDGFYDFAVGLYTQTSFTTGVALFSEPSVTRMNAGELTVDGTVTARQLESELVLTTKVVAGDPAATHAEMSPLGFKVFASPAGGGTPTEVVRMGVASSDDYFALSKADGSLAATISQDGVISSAQSNVSDALYYKGEELTGILDRLPGGMVAWGKRTTASKNPADTSTRQPFLRVDFPARKGRAYRITTTPIWSSGNGTGAGAYIRLNYRDDGGVVSAFSDMLSGGVAPEQSITNAWEAAPLSLSGMIYPSKDVVASVMISFQGMGTGTVHLNGNVNYPICIFVDDVGPLVSDLGQYLDGNGTSTPPPDPPIKQSYYKEYTLTGASSYQGNGSYYAYNESKMYQGLSPAGAGNLTSIACFQSMTSDLAGATITGMRVYLYFEFWYYNAGGTAYLGLHGHSTPPATFSHSVSGFTASGGWPRPGGRWVDIPSAYWAGFKSGAYKGISLQSPTGYEYYGFASENAIISASYTK